MRLSHGRGRNSPLCRRLSPEDPERGSRHEMALKVEAFALEDGRCHNPRRHRWDSPPKIRFAPDSPLEGAGFEPSVPLEVLTVGIVPCRLRGLRWTPIVGQPEPLVKV